MPDVNEFKEAFYSIAPVPYDTIDSEDDLAAFLRKSYTQAEIVLSSLPDPPNAPSDESSTSYTPPPANSATKAADTFCDPSSVPKLRHSELEHLQKQWGKPIKLSASINPLGVCCYKTAAHDRHGAWFGRRSVHQGLGFERWKRGMQREFPVSLKVTSGPGQGAVRGISADQRLEEKEIGDVGKIEGQTIWLYCKRTETDLT